MFTDIVLLERNKEIKDFMEKELGFSNVFFKEDFDKLSLVIGGDAFKNLKALENKNTKILVSAESRERDSMHQRNSGLNQVLCKLAAKNKIIIGFSLSNIDSLEMLGKVMQNIKLCKKYKVRMIFITLAKNKFELRDARDMIAFCRVLGMNPLEAKNALSYTQ